MWEPRALDLFQVVILGCGPALHLIVRSGFLGSIQSRVATWSWVTERSFPSLLGWAKSLTALALTQNICFPCSYLCTNGPSFKIYLFMPPSSVKYAVPKWCLKNLCGKTWCLSFSVNVLNSAEAIWKNLLAYKLICNTIIFLVCDTKALFDRIKDFFLQVANISL